MEDLTIDDLSKDKPVRGANEVKKYMKSECIEATDTGLGKMICAVERR